MPETAVSPLAEKPGSSSCQQSCSPELRREKKQTHILLLMRMTFTQGWMAASPRPPTDRQTDRTDRTDSWKTFRKRIAAADWIRLDRHLHVQLQNVCVRLQQLTHVGFGAAEVAVDKLLNVAVVYSLRKPRHLWVGCLRCRFPLHGLESVLIAAYEKDTCQPASSGSDRSDEGPAGVCSCCAQPSGGRPGHAGAGPSGGSFGPRSGP